MEEVDEEAIHNMEPSTSESESNANNTYCDCLDSAKKRIWSCEKHCKNNNKSQQSQDPDHKLAEALSMASNASTSYRSNDNVTESTDDKEQQNIDSNFKVMMGLEPENAYDAEGNLI